jgi:type II secretory ATPase GspE/PulE/Tfp pilus assembly ATPase PilB-like protein
MDSGKVGNLYQARTSPMRDAKGNPIPCTFCHDLAFNGRLGIYEILVVDKEIKDLIRNGGADFDQQMKVAFRKQRSRYLQEMALQLVEAGDTSLNEVQRVLKGETSSPSSGKSPSRPKPA